MFSKESLYINAIKYTNQLKINYKKLNNNDIVETNSSTFIAKDDILGRDIATKLNNHASEINNTYISSLLIADDTILLKKKSPRPKDYEVTVLNNDYNIAISKNNLFETRNYFEKCGVDYIFSAYHILNLHIEQNPCNNNLVVLLFNDQAFCVVLNEKNEIIFNKKINLTAFDDIKKSKFYENEVLGQKLFDEVYVLELNEAIQNTIEEFYASSKNVFIERISLLYNIKILTNDQVKQMSDEFMIDTTYHPISVDEELFELSKDNHTHKSFIKPRPKPTNTFRNFVFALAIFAVVFAASAFVLPYKKWLGFEDKKIETKTVAKPKEIVNKPIKRKVVLPNHMQINSELEFKVLKALEVIPYDMVLTELTVDDDKLLLDVNMLNKDTFIKVIKPELQKDYKEVDISFKESKKPVLKATINVEGFKDKKQIETKEYKDVYLKNEFMSIITVTEQLKMLFPKNTSVNFKSSSKENNISFDYLVNVLIQSPLEFFRIIEILNNEMYSININYPVNFVKTEAGIEVEFILQFNQPK
ncbi:hypothetical protein CRV01_02555 [Arcobacter sp. CECT 8983]|uniref:hypothetical protein n=1 Tax=Arcobacter sp. CECT 8983 TaxID=2044508 RepID=UPI00100ABC43|nr:hypothetical protein [Arcobacter sp. CECT 8983]RXJ91179.1 hypothetical protein CRV01_02555 [Arcobacter sp. CECT 8983]